MESLSLEPPKDKLKPQTVHQLQTIDELMAWEIWKNAHAGYPLTQEHADRKCQYYQSILSENGYVGSGISYMDPAVFAVYRGGRIVAGGSVYTRTCSYPRYYLQEQAKYAFTTDALTDSDFYGQGLNTQITRSRIEWATQNNLPLIVTNVKPTIPASIQAKLKAGFVIDSFADTYLTLMLPLNDRVSETSGIHINQPKDGIEVAITSLRVDDFIHNYGSASQKTNPTNGLFIRMIPRDFGDPREI